MSENKVSPDRETGDLLLSICGLDSPPYRKFARMRYWNSKFSNMSPFPVPLEMPNDAAELARMAIKQITGVDKMTVISTYQTEEDLTPDQAGEEKTWIVSGISPAQKQILNSMPKVRFKFFSCIVHFANIFLFRFRMVHFLSKELFEFG